VCINGSANGRMLDGSMKGSMRVGFLKGGKVNVPMKIAATETGV